MKDRKKAISFDVNENGCFVCTSHYRDKDGYPLRFENGRQQRLHRIVFLHHNPVPDIPNFVVRHTCDNPGCINPHHLVAGTQADNVRDSIIRGRRATGEHNGSAVLSEQDINNIRSSPLGNSLLALQFNISRTHVWRIRSGKSWIHCS